MSRLKWLDLTLCWFRFGSKHDVRAQKHSERQHLHNDNVLSSNQTDKRSLWINVAFVSREGSEAAGDVSTEQWSGERPASHDHTCHLTYQCLISTTQLFYVYCSKWGQTLTESAATYIKAYLSKTSQWFSISLMCPHTQSSSSAQDFRGPSALMGPVVYSFMAAVCYSNISLLIQRTLTHSDRKVFLSMLN